MSPAKIRKLLEFIGGRLKQFVMDVALEDTEEGPALTITVASPFGDEEGISYTIMVEDTGEGLAMMQIMMTVFYEVPEERFDDVDDLITEINTRTTMGYFSLFEDAGLVLYNQSFLMDAGAATELAAALLSRCMIIMEASVKENGAWIDRLLKGEETPEEILSAMKERSESV